MRIARLLWSTRQIWGMALCAVDVSSVMASPAAGEPPASVETYPQGGVIAQPRRVSVKQNNSTKRSQGDWGQFNWGNGEFAGFGPVGMYGVAPWAEDWSDRRYQKNRTDVFDPLKFIALNSQGSVWLSLSGESRLRNWYETRPQLGSVSVRNSERFTVRNLYGADLHLGEHWRVFGQLNNSEASGTRYYGYGSTWRRRLGLQQFFTEIKGSMAGARVGVMVGRQQFLDVPSWLVYNRETSNVPLSWNGVRGYAMWDAFRLDAYNFVATQVTRDHIMGGGFDDGTRLYGVDVTRAIPLFSIGKQSIHSFLDIFWMGFRFEGGQAALARVNGSTSGTQTRQNVGFRWYGSAPEFEYDFSADYQTGRFFSSVGGMRSIGAGAGRAIIGWRHSSSFLHPFLGMQAELYTGSNSYRKTGQVSGFIVPFSPQTGTFDSTLTLVRSNSMSIGPVMSIAPRPFMNIRVRVPFMWRQTLNDGVYNASSRFSFLSGRVLRSAGRWVGSVPQGSVQFQINQHVNWQIDGGGLLMSRRMREAGAKRSGYMLSTVTFRF